MATSFPTYPATTFEQAVELAIFSSNQLHNIINADPLSAVETEDGDIPSVRKALIDNLYFKTPITWTEGGTNTTFNQLYYFYQDGVVNGYYFAPTASTTNPITLGSTPVGDDNWTLYSAVSQTIPAEVYPYTYTATGTTTSVTPGYTFDTAIVTVNGVILVPDVDYTVVSSSSIALTSPIGVDADTGVGDVLYALLGTISQGSGADYATLTDLAKSTGAGLIGTSAGNTVQDAITSLSSNIASAVNKDSLAANDGNLLIGKCPTLADLPGIEPTVDGQTITVIARTSDWQTSLQGSPWGGGEFQYVASATTTLFPAVDGAIYWTSGGRCWVRSSLISPGSLGVIYAEWFADTEANLVNDWSDALNAANTCAETLINSLNPKFGRVCYIKTPPMFGLSKSVIINPNAATLKGKSFCQVTPSANFTVHPQASTKTSVANFTYAIGLISTQISTSSSSYTCYWDRPYVEDITIVCSSNTDPYKMPYAEQKTTPTNYISAFCHYGYAPTTAETNITGTVMASQGSFQNVSVIGFPIGYTNGDYAWGVNFWECKWIGCYYSQFLISGSDNGERMNFYGNVWQNGTHGIWNEDWEGDGKVIGGSAVWMIGYYFNIKGSTAGWDIALSRTEYVIQANSLYLPIVNVNSGTATGTLQKFPVVNFSSVLCLVSTNQSSTISTNFHLFNSDQYCEVNIRDTGWQFQAWSQLPGISLVNPSNAGIAKAHNNGSVRIGSHAQWGRVPALSMITPNAGTFSNSITQSGTDAGVSYAFNSSSGTFTITTTAATTGTVHLYLTIPIDNMRDFNNLVPWFKFSSISLTKDAYLTCSLRNSRLPTTSTVDFVAINLNSRQTSPSNIYPYYSGSSTQPVWKRRDELSFVPDTVYLDFWIPAGTPSGSSIVLSNVYLSGI